MLQKSPRSLLEKVEATYKAVAGLPKQIRDLTRSLRKVHHRLRDLELEVNNLIIELKERTLIGDVPPPGGWPKDVPPIQTYPAPDDPEWVKIKPVAPESPRMVMYGVASVGGTTGGDYKTWTSGTITTTPWRKNRRPGQNGSR